MEYASTKPARAPMNKVGPKVPPTPPPALVNVMENTFRSSTIIKNRGMAQGQPLRKSKGVLPPKEMSGCPFRRGERKL